MRSAAACRLRTAVKRRAPARPRAAIGFIGGAAPEPGTGLAPSDMEAAHFARRCVMGVIGWIVFGALVGIVAKFLMPGRDPGGFIVTIILGIVGALVGGYVGRVLGMYRQGDPVGFVMAVVGSIILLTIYRFVARRPRTV